MRKSGSANATLDPWVAFFFVRTRVRDIDGATRCTLTGVSPLRATLSVASKPAKPNKQPKFWFPTSKRQRKKNMATLLGELHKAVKADDDVPRIMRLAQGLAIEARGSITLRS
jgi:hypothetical protein